MNYGSHRNTARRQPTLIRGADGKLRPASGEYDIGDLWAHQSRLQLGQSIEESRRQAARERLRQEQGWIGVAIVELDKLYRQARTALFGTQPLPIPKPLILRPTGNAGKPAPGTAAPKTTPAAKTVEIKIALPTAPRLQLETVRRKLAKIPRRAYIAAGSAAAAIALLLGAFQLFLPAPYVEDAGAAGVLGAETSGRPALQRGTPDFATILPAGKDIDALGGWTRISPPDRDPVYAYVDKIGRTTVSVSQQPLPAAFKDDTADKVAELARGFNATDKLPIDGTTVYIGKSTDGPQSVIFSKDKLLILIKSTAPLTNDQWAQYIDSLK